MTLLRQYFLLVLLFSVSTVVNASERYLLNAGDVLDISVWNEEALQKQVVILPDGMIAFPLAGELMAQGKTVTELQAKLKENLSEYLSEPVVTVSVTNVSGNTVHVMGKVTQPGSFAMSQPLNVMQALSLSGGLSPYAEEDNIIVLRQNDGKEQVIPVHYSAIKKGKDLTSNVTLKSGDVIVIP
ncbi:hypothetical protein LCGC14_1175110 [marine sediment metagenome]|uniref:Uncharacterized protein n=1 Tax=marine sediment metagenome TaxID=412755 RepID=A0A0F9PU65_9ZZZZ|nr:polysaccharide export protein [Methylophaga sp.]